MKALRPAGSWACAAWLAVQAATAGAAPSLRYAKPIATPPRDKEELVAVTLDGDVFAATREGFPDVRILDDAGAETAFVLRPASERRTTKVRQTWSAANPRIKLLDDDGLEITVELAERDPTPLGLRLKTPLVNFEQRVRVFASVDGDEWQPVLEEGVIFDYSQFMDVRNDSLELTPPAIDAGAAPPRHYRIVIDDVTKEQQSQLMELTRRLRGEDETGRSERVAIVRQPFRIDEIEFWSDVEKQEVAGAAAGRVLSESGTCRA